MDFFDSAYAKTRKGSTPAFNEFDEGKYDGEWLQIGDWLQIG